jgi:gliding motility-associated-like protein
MKIIAFIICSLTATLAHAQSLYNQSVISIGPSSVLFVKDSIINNGTIVNNGDMQVGGSWINNDQYDAGQGQITFNSNLPQVINHNDQAFSKLTISGGGEKLFRANITIENELNLSGGILATDNDSKIIFNSTAQFTGGSDNAHIAGPVYHKGTGSKVYPIGNGSVYLPVELSNIEGSTAEIGIRAVELNGMVLQAAPSLQAISATRYFTLDIISGSIANSVVTLPVRDESIVTNEEEVVVAQAATVSAAFESLGALQFGGDVTNGTVTSSETVTLPFLAVGTRSTDGSLVVYNAISPNTDQLNQFLIIGNIENYPENTFTLFSRWGDKLFQIENYDNKERVFRGKSNVNGENDLVNGTYFYVIETKKGSLKVNGFLSLKH